MSVDFIHLVLVLGGCLAAPYLAIVLYRVLFRKKPHDQANTFVNCMKLGLSSIGIVSASKVALALLSNQLYQRCQLSDSETAYMLVGILTVIAISVMGIIAVYHKLTQA